MGDKKDHTNCHPIRRHGRRVWILECCEDGRCGRGNLLAGFIFCRRRHNIGNGIAALGLSRKKCTDEICWGGPGEIEGGGTKKWVGRREMGEEEVRQRGTKLSPRKRRGERGGGGDGDGVA